MVAMFLNGTAMTGGADHHLTAGAILVGKAITAPRYRFHCVDGRYPALQEVPAGGAAIEGELYEMSYRQLREVLLPGEPAGLELGVIELADGTGALAMLLRRPYEPEPLADISAFGSWRRYRETEP